MKANRVEPERVQVEDIGEVLFRRNKRAKRLTISIRQTKEIRVTIPGSLPFHAAHSFVVRKKSWILEKLRAIAANGYAILTNESNYSSRTHVLRFYPQPRKNIHVTLAQGEIRIYYPDAMSGTEEQLQLAARRGIELAYRHEAHLLLPQRVKELAITHGFQYKNLSIKRTTSRWGSC